MPWRERAFAYPTKVEVNASGEAGTKADLTGLNLQGATTGIQAWVGDSQIANLRQFPTGGACFWRNARVERDLRHSCEVGPMARRPGGLAARKLRKRLSPDFPLGFCAQPLGPLRV